MRDDLINILGAPKEKTIYIPNIAVPVKINRVKYKYLKRISIIGSIQKRKNQLDAVKILEHIEDNNVILQIYGHELDKDYATLIKDYIKRKGLEHRVKFMGIAQESEIYSNSDLVILTSEHEGFGYTFLESAMYKIPVLAYDFKYGAKEFSQDGKNGCLFKMGDYISMASKISEIFEDEEIFNNIVKINSEFFEKSYAKDKIVEMYLQLGGRSKTIFKLDDLSKKNNGIKVLDVKKSENKLVVENNFWGIVEKEEKDFYVFKCKIYNANINEIKVFFIKGKKYYIDFETKYNANRNAHYLFKINKNNQTNNQILFKIEKIFKNKPLNKFFIGIETKNKKEHYIGYIDKNGNYECISNLKTYYPNKIGKFNINDFDHILNKEGLLLRYPKNEHISKIEDEKSNMIEYTTKYLRYYGEYIPFFRIKSGLYNKLKITMNSGETSIIDFSQYSFKDIFLKLSTIENEFNLFEMKIQDIYIWELIRAEIFEKILENTGVLDKHFTKKTTNKVVQYSGNKNIWNIPNTEKLIFEFPRKNGDKDYRTIALHSNDSIILEYPQEGSYSDKVYDVESNVFPIERYLKYFSEYKVDVKYSNLDKEKIKFLKKIFLEKIGIEIEFLAFIDGRIKKFKKEFAFFDKFFTEKNIGEVSIPSSYWSAGIIAAAQKHSVLASDIQYALISLYHPTFAFPEDKRKYQADRIYIWSKYWNIREVPFNKSIALKSNYFTKKVKDLDLYNKEVKYDIAFISQSRIGEKVLESTYLFAKSNKDLKIVYCLHPDEDIYNYRYYEEIIKLNNVKISNDETIVEVSQSNSVIAVYSTTIFEALALNKRVFILKLNGWELLEKELKLGYVELIENVEDIHNHLFNTKVNKINFAKLFYNM